MADDWDMNAIVRSCSSTAAAPDPSFLCSNSNNLGHENNPMSEMTFDDEPDPFTFPDLATQQGDSGYRSFLDLLQNSAIVSSCSSTAAAPDPSASCSNSNNLHHENNPLFEFTFDDEPDPFAILDLAAQPEDSGYRSFLDLLLDSSIVRSCSSTAAASDPSASCSNSNNLHHENNPLFEFTFDDEPDPFAILELAAQPGDSGYRSFLDLLLDSSIVRSCSSTAAASDPSASCSNSNNLHHENNPLSEMIFDDEPDPFAQPGDSSFLDLLQDSYNPISSPAAAGGWSVLIPPFDITTATASSSNSGASSLPRTTESAVSPRVVNQNTNQQLDLGGRHGHQQLQSTITLGPPSSSVVVHPALRTAANMPSQPAARSRKKKNNQKRLGVQVTADNLSNDVWAWRKYGHKILRGSLYERNYYRCSSSSKGCPARKQVERSTTDPNMFIISYAGDHTHPKPTRRHPLAGSTRTKFPAAKAGATEVKESEAVVQPAPPPTTKEKATSAAAATVILSPTTPLSATMDHNNQNNVDPGTGVADMMTIADIYNVPEFESGEDDANKDDFHNIFDDADDDHDDNIFIPNNNNVERAVDEDIFMKGWQEIGGGGGGGGDDDGDGFWNIFSSWI